MWHYRLRTPSINEAQQLAVVFGIDWDGESKHITQINDLPNGESHRIDVVILGDLPKQNPDGGIQTTQETIDGELMDVPVMSGKFHADILSSHKFQGNQADIYLIDPQHPQHGFAGVVGEKAEIFK